MPRELSEQIKQALDVAAAFDNCFFHSYAMHLIANKLPFPKDLFTYTSIRGDKSPASQLQKRFSNQDSLSLFAEYAQRQHPGEKVGAASFVFEKTLVLGLLLREWFASEMAGNLDIRDALQAKVVLKFIAYAEFRNYLPLAELALGEEGVLYTANAAFLEYFYQRSQGGIIGKLSLQEQQFERYFTTNDENINKALIAYWDAQGYPKYCQLLATPNVKLAQSDVSPVMRLLGQPLTIYNPDASVLHVIDAPTRTPKMELVLHAADGHYCLLKAKGATATYAEYAKSYTQYKKDRGETLATAGNKLTVAHSKPSLLVGAICPTGLLEKTPFAFLVEKVDALRNFVLEFDKTKDDAQRHQEQEEAQRRQEQEEAQRRQEQEEAQRCQEQEEAQRRQEQEEARRTQIEQMFAKIDAALMGLNHKIGLVEQHHLHTATVKAQELLARLTTARDDYYRALTPAAADRVVASVNFKKECVTIINNAKPVLARDLGWGDYLSNLLRGLINLVTYGVTFGTVHTFFTPIKSAALEALEQLEPVLVC